MKEAIKKAAEEYSDDYFDRESFTDGVKWMQSQQQAEYQQLREAFEALLSEYQSMSAYTAVYSNEYWRSKAGIKPIH